MGWRWTWAAVGLLCSAMGSHTFAATQEPSGFDAKPWPTGQASPAFDAIDMQGLRWRFVDLRGQALVINFWASWCEPCRAEMPSLEKLASQYPGRLRVLTINFKESPRTVAAFKERLSLQLPVVIDADGVLAKTYGVRIFPSTVLIDSSGKVRSVVRGSLDWSGPQGRALVGPLLTKLLPNADVSE